MVVCRVNKQKENPKRKRKNKTKQKKNNEQTMNNATITLSAESCKQHTNKALLFSHVVNDM